MTRLCLVCLLSLFASGGLAQQDDETILPARPSGVSEPRSESDPAEPPAEAKPSAPAKVEALEDAPRLTSGAGVKKEKVAEALADDTAAAQMLVVGLRSDVAFTAGRPTDQGFALAGLRLSVSGEIARYLDYRVALAPSREFSSVLVPQVLPVEAWVQFRDSGRNRWQSEASVFWKAGMFAPTLHPMFGVDLAELPIPNYATTHQAGLLFRELGTEVTLRPVPGVLDVTAGIFNGTGIIALNTNNSKAFCGSAVLHLALNGFARLRVGVAGLGSRQSESGSVNYIANTVGTAFVLVNWGEFSLFALDVVAGRLEDTSGALRLFGVTATGYIGLNPWLRAFVRAEATRYSPATRPSLDRFQIGPAFDPARGVRIFAYYEQLTDGSASPENAGQILLRVSL